MIKKTTPKLPTEQIIRKEGVFLGYDCGLGGNYSEVYRYDSLNWNLLDTYIPSKNKVVYNVARFYGRIGKLVRLFAEAEHGSPL